METDVEVALSHYVKELKSRCPGVLVETPGGLKVRVKAPSPEEVGTVLRTASELQMDWYLDEGVYIELSVTGTGPVTG